MRMDFPSFDLKQPMRPLHIWLGYAGIAIVLSIIGGKANWVPYVMGLYLIWAIYETVRFFRHRKKSPAGEALARQWVETSENEGNSSQADEGDEGDEGDVEDIEDPDVMGKERKWSEDDDVRESQRDFETLWKGSKAIAFVYRNKGYGKPIEITATVTTVISPEFGEDQNTYFHGCPVGGQPRYFCLGYVKGKKVTDVDTGENGTLRKILGVKRRVYK